MEQVMVLETERLSLAQLTAQDAPFILQLVNEPSFIQNIGDRGVRTITDAEKLCFPLKRENKPFLTASPTAPRFEDESVEANETPMKPSSISARSSTTPKIES